MNNQHLKPMLKIYNPTYVKINRDDGSMGYHPLPIHIEFKPEEKDVFPEGWYITISDSIEGVNGIESDNSVTYSVTKKEYDRLIVLFDMLTTACYQVSETPSSDRK